MGYVSRRRHNPVPCACECRAAGNTAWAWCSIRGLTFKNVTQFSRDRSQSRHPRGRTRHAPLSRVARMNLTANPSPQSFWSGGIPGLKARHVIARPEGPGSGITKISRGLKGRHTLAPVPALQAGGEFAGTHSRGFTPGSPMTGFQPYASGAMNNRKHMPFRQVVADSSHPISNPVPGPKARHVTARPVGPGERPPITPSAL